MIAIVDCNNFYASCERAFNPSLRGKPICILSNNDGCVIARSNEAKALNIPMGAPYHLWKDEFKRKNIHIFSSNYALYGDMSARVMKILKSAVTHVEVYSIDEAFLDLSTQGSPYEFCKELSDAVYQYTGIPVSIGLAPTKTLAKVANRMGKKLGKKAFQITKENHLRILAEFPVEDIWGVGRQYTKFLNKEGVHTALELIQRPDSWIQKHMTTPGLWTALELRGNPCFPFEETSPPKQNIMASRSFGYPLRDKQVVSEAIANHVARAAEKLRSQDSLAGGIAVFLNTNRFSTTIPYTMSSGYLQFHVSTADTSVMIETALRIFEKLYQPELPYHKAGICLAEITPNNIVQCSLWNSWDSDKKISLLNTVDQYNRRNGKNSIFYGAMGTQKKWALRSNFLSHKYTTSFSDLLVLKI